MSESVQTAVSQTSALRLRPSPTGLHLRALTAVNLNDKDNGREHISYDSGLWHRHRPHRCQHRRARSGPAPDRVTHSAEPRSDPGVSAQSGCTVRCVLELLFTVRDVPASSAAARSCAVSRAHGGAADCPTVPQLTGRIGNCHKPHSYTLVTVSDTSTLVAAGAGYPPQGIMHRRGGKWLVTSCCRR